MSARAIDDMMSACIAANSVECLDAVGEREQSSRKLREAVSKKICEGDLACTDHYLDPDELLRMSPKESRALLDVLKSLKSSIGLFRTAPIMSKLLDLALVEDFSPARFLDLRTCLMPFGATISSALVFCNDDDLEGSLSVGKIMHDWRSGSRGFRENGERAFVGITPDAADRYLDAAMNWVPYECEADHR